MPSEKTTDGIVLGAFVLSGCSALVYEVVWTRALSLILGSTVYALSTMLSTFMAGLALGALIGGRLADGKRNRVALFGWLELGIALFGLVTVPLIYFLPKVYFWMYGVFHLSPATYFAAQFLLCAAVMLVPTTLMGATFPVVSRRLTRDLGEVGRKVGFAYSMNTMGAIAGSLLAGFVLIPVVGLRWTSFVGGVVNLAGAIALFAASRCALAHAAKAVPLVAIAATVSASSEIEAGHPFATLYQAMRFDNATELAESDRGLDLLFSKDLAEGSLRAYRERSSGLLLLQNGGKLEGTAEADLLNTLLLATLPAAASSERPGRLLVIGLGAGVTTWAAKSVADRVEVAEINPGVVEVVRRYGNPGTLSNVEVHVTDARRHLTFSDTQYDVITSEPSVPTDAGTAGVFTKEFYEIAATRLSDGGVFCQWLPAWILTQQDARACVKTFATVFEQVLLWKINESDFIMLGSRTPIGPDPDAIVSRALGLASVALGKEPGADAELASAVRLVRDPSGAKQILAMEDVPVLTDDRPMLEFAVTRNLIAGQGFQRLPR